VKIPDVIGGAELLPKQSDVDALGNLCNEPIEGVIFRPTRPVAHDDGYVTEVARASWCELTTPLVQVHITTTLPGRIRAWGSMSLEPIACSLYRVWFVSSCSMAGTARLPRGG
jgi:hypothetical protein